MSQEISRYKETIIGVLNSIEAQSLDGILEAAEVMADAIEADHLVHVIGTGGHSSMAAEELLWRAGGLAALNPILDPGINLVHGAKRTNVVERFEGYAATIFASYHLGETPGEVILIANAYGINSLTIDMVTEAKRRGMKVIGVTSRSFADQVPKGVPARHSSGQNLYEIVDVFVNCQLPYGDAVVDVQGLEQRVAPTSTFCNAFTINCIVIETVKKLIERGVTPPVWMSANLPGGDEANRKWEEKYAARVKHL